MLRQTLFEEKEEKFSTEGDLIFSPSTSMWNRAEKVWIPFSSMKEKLCFYDPEDHVDLAKALFYAPIQSRERILETIDE